MWPFKPRGMSPVLLDLVKLLESGSLTHVDLDSLGICELGGEYLGKRFSVSWYPSGYPRDVILGGDRFFATGQEADYLVRVAKSRAKQLFRERLTNLERLRVVASNSNR